MEPFWDFLRHRPWARRTVLALIVPFLILTAFGELCVQIQAAFRCWWRDLREFTEFYVEEWSR